MKNFADIDPKRKIYESDRFFVIKDAYPVSPGHSLIISKDLKANYFDLSKEEKADLVGTIEIVKELLLRQLNM